MLAEAISTMQELTYAGRFSPRALIVCGIAIAVTAGLLTWWEARAANRWLALALLPLRLIAMGVILWMLAEPTMRTVTHRSHPSSIAVMEDVSASMGIVDSDDPDVVKAVRWAAMEEMPGQATLMTLIDAVTFNLNMARHHYDRLLAEADKNAPASLLKNKTEQIKRGVQAAEGKLAELIGRAPGKAGMDARGLDGIASGIREFLVPAIAELARTIQDGQLIAQTGSDDQVREVLNRFTEQSATLALTWGTTLEQIADPSTRDALAQQTVQSREAKATNLLKRVETASLRDIAKQAEILRYMFHQAVIPVPDFESPNSNSKNKNRKLEIEQAQATDLTAAMERIEQDAATRSVKAIVLVTDGGHNTSSDPLKKAAAIGGPPVFIVSVGNSEPNRDVMLHHVQAPRRAFVNDLVTIEGMLDAHDCMGEKLTLELLVEDEIVDQQTIAVTADYFYTPIQFRRKVEQFGVTKFQLRIQPVLQEQNEENNRANVQVEVIEGAMRVFLADQFPRWEFRYLRNLWKRDEHIDMDSVLFQPAQTVSEETGVELRLPDTTDGWSRYRVVVLGDLSPEVLTSRHQESLKDYISSRGGVLLLIAGDRAMPASYFDGPLGPLIPVKQAPHDLTGAVWHLAVTPAGRSADLTQIADDVSGSDRVWREHFSFYELSPYSLPQLNSQVLISAVSAGDQTELTEQPAYCCWQRYGQGRVLYLAGPATWRLRLQYGDRYHHRFWGQLLRWATGTDIGTDSTTVRLVTDKMSYQPEDTVQLSAHLNHPNGQAVSAAEVTVVATQRESQVATVILREDEDSPGTYRATLRRLQPGELILRVDGPQVRNLLAEVKDQKSVETRVMIEPSLSQELRNTRCNLPLLTKLAEATGGAVLPPTMLSTALSTLDLAPDVSEEVRQQPIWPRWRYLGLVVGCLCLEWVIRKLSGLV